MWKVYVQDPASGAITERNSAPDVAACKAIAAQVGQSLVLWDGVVPSSQADQDKLFQDVFAANGDKVSQITLGLTMPEPQKNASLSSCPGRCFCVIANGQRRCETYYCFASGLCYWVSCGMGC
jgi:hypothetical protein